MKNNSIPKICFYAVLVLFLLYAYRHRILEYINDIFYKDIQVSELTMSQKLEDFNSFYFNIKESVPFLDEIDRLYHINFEKRYDYYEKKINETKDNFEFFCTMKAISKDIPSFHTDVCFPLYSNLRYMDSYDSNKVMTGLGQKAEIDAWYELIGEACEKYENVKTLRFSYVDGVYLMLANEKTEDDDRMDDYQLLQINGVDIDRYVTENISTFRLYYDYTNEKAYREAIVLNDSEGTRVEVVLQNQEHIQHTETMYISYGIEVVDSYGYLFDASGLEPEYVPVSMYRDDQRRVEYIEVNDFTNREGERLKQYIKESPYDNIIIDLRNNYGGRVSYGVNYLYPYLYEMDTEFSYRFRVNDTKSNDAMTKDLPVWLSFNREKEGQSFIYSRSEKYIGKAEKTKNVFYLTGRRTGSAADGYIAMIKEKGLGTIVGDVTGSEGRGGSFVCSKMKNSSLIYIYYPALALENEDEERDYEGILPDYFVNENEEEYRLRQHYLLDGTESEYEKKLEFDAPLKKVIFSLLTK